MGRPDQSPQVPPHKFPALPCMEGRVRDGVGQRKPSVIWYWGRGGRRCTVRGLLWYGEVRWNGAVELTSAVRDVFLDL